MKKTNGIILIIFTVIVLIVAIIFAHRLQNRLDDIRVPETEWDEIISTRVESEYSLIDDITFNGYSLLKADNKYYYSLVENDDYKYNPMIHIESSISNLSIVSLSDINDNNIENNIEVELLVYDDNRYQKINVVCTTLPIISIDYNGEITKENSANMDMTLFDNRDGIKEKIIDTSGRIHYRGASTMNFPKKSYRIILDENLSLFNLRDDNDWILYSLYNDQEKVRNVFSSNLWYDCCSNSNEFGITNGYQYKYVELIVNGEYNGLYALGYPVDEKMMNLSVDTDDNYNEYLYKKEGWNSIEWESIDKYKNLFSDYNIKNEIKNTDQAWSILKNTINNVFFSNNKSDIIEHSDMSNFIDLYLFYNFIQAVDNAGDTTINNAYVTIKKDNENYKIIVTPWDMDQTFGNIWNEKYLNYIHEYGFNIKENRIMKFSPVHLLLEMDDKDITLLLKERYKELHDLYFNEITLSKLIDKYEKQIYDSGAFIRDKNKWPDGNYNSEVEKLSTFKSYVLERLKYMDKYMEEEFGY